MPENVLGPEFWQAEEAALLAVLLPLITEAGQQAAEGGITLLAELTGADVAVDWTILNAEAVVWAQTFTEQVVAGITDTNVKAFVDAFGPWLESGEPLPKLIEALEPMYGPVRANAIAVTETTRAFAEGNRLAWREADVTQVRFRTAFDELVCPICQPFEGQVFDIEDGEHAPPLHVNCRCFLQPVVNAGA